MRRSPHRKSGTIHWSVAQAQLLTLQKNDESLFEQQIKQELKGIQGLIQVFVYDESIKRDLNIGLM